MPWTVTEDCTGCNLCCDTAPTIFKMDDEKGVAIVIDVNAPKDHPQAKEAAESCPVEAIKFAD